MVFCRIGCFIAFCCLSFSPAAHSESSYHIGNSLTWMMSPDGLGAMARSNGIPLDVGYHIAFGKGLDFIWDHPEEITRTNRPGGFSAALTESSWRHVTLQPFGAGETLETDIERMIDFIDLALSGSSGDTRFYIFQTWPVTGVPSYGAEWTRPVVNDPGVTAVHSRQYFENLRINLLDHYGPDFPLFIIPLGEVLNELDNLFRDGQFEAYESIFDLYLDKVHLGDFGNWIVVNAVYATLFGRDPTGILKPEGFYGEGSNENVSPEENQRMQALVWKVVSKSPYAGVAPVSVEF